MTATWKAGGFETSPILADGKPHAWQFAYDPEATVPKEWPDAKLREYLGAARRSEADLLTAAHRDEPGLTAQMLARLARAETLV